MVGQNILPAGYDPVVDGVPESEVREILADIRNVYHAAVQRMPPHHAFVAKFCSGNT